MIKVLHSLVPGSDSIITELSDITADSVLECIKSAGFLFYINKLSDGEWDVESSELDDEKILDMIQISLAGHQGKLLIVTEACSRYNLPVFECEAESLSDFIRHYNREMFFDGDVIILGEDSRTFTVYHHEGAYAHVKV